MAAEVVPQEYTSRIETVAGYKIAVISYRLGGRYIAKVEIRVPGAEARLSFSEDASKTSAEGRALADARWLIERTTFRA